MALPGPMGGVETLETQKGGWWWLENEISDPPFNSSIRKAATPLHPLHAHLFDRDPGEGGGGLVGIHLLMSRGGGGGAEGAKIKDIAR